MDPKIARWKYAYFSYNLKGRLTKSGICVHKLTGGPCAYKRCFRAFTKRNQTRNTLSIFNSNVYEMLLKKMLKIASNTEH